MAKYPLLLELIEGRINNDSGRTPSRMRISANETPAVKNFYKHFVSTSFWNFFLNEVKFFRVSKFRYDDMFVHHSK